jgi:hypothetical protein
VLGVEHPSTLTSTANLASTYSKTAVRRSQLHVKESISVESASERQSSGDLFYWNVLGKMVPVRRCSSPAIPFVPQMLDCTCSFNKLRFFPRWWCNDSPTGMPFESTPMGMMNMASGALIFAKISHRKYSRWVGLKILPAIVEHKAGQTS